MAGLQYMIPPTGFRGGILYTGMGGKTVYNQDLATDIEELRRGHRRGGLQMQAPVDGAAMNGLQPDPNIKMVAPTVDAEGNAIAPALDPAKEMYDASTGNRIPASMYQHAELRAAATAGAQSKDKRQALGANGNNLYTINSNDPNWQQQATDKSIQYAHEQEADIAAQQAQRGLEFKQAKEQSEIEHTQAETQGLRATQDYKKNQLWPTELKENQAKLDKEALDLAIQEKVVKHSYTAEALSALTNPTMTLEKHKATYSDFWKDYSNISRNPLDNSYDFQDATDPTKRYHVTADELQAEIQRHLEAAAMDKNPDALLIERMREQTLANTEKYQGLTMQRKELMEQAEPIRQELIQANAQLARLQDKVATPPKGGLDIHFVGGLNRELVRRINGLQANYDKIMGKLNALDQPQGQGLGAQQPEQAKEPPSNPLHDQYNFLDATLKGGKNPKTDQPLTALEIKLAKDKMNELYKQINPK